MEKQNIKEPSGILILDKPTGITSHDAVYKMRKLFSNLFSLIYSSCALQIRHMSLG